MQPFSEIRYAPAPGGLYTVQELGKGENRRAVKWKLLSKYESNHGPGTTQCQMGQKTRNRPRMATATEEVLQAGRSLPTPPELFWPTGSDGSDVCLPAAAAAVALSCGFGCSCTWRWFRALFFCF